MTWQFLAAGSLISAGLALTWLIQSTVLLALGLLAGRLLRRRGPAVQSALYRTTLGAVILCPAASVFMAAMGINGLLFRMPASPYVDRNVLANQPAGPQIPPATDANEPRSQPDGAGGARASQARISPMLPAIDAAPASEAGVVPPMVASVPQPVQSDELAWWPDLVGLGSALIMAAWFLGVAALGIRLVVGHRRMARLRSSAIAAEPDVLALCRDLARQMRLDAPSVLRTPFLCSPCLDGLRRPAILLPEDAEENLRETFIHELAHLERRDGLWNLLRHVATAFFWVQPLLWCLSKRLEATAEEVCDDYVVELEADQFPIRRPSARIGRAPAAAAGAVGRRDDLAAIPLGAADYADPRLNADALHSGRSTGHRRDAARWLGRYAPGGVARRRCWESRGPRRRAEVYELGRGGRSTLDDFPAISSHGEKVSKGPRRRPG